MRGLRMGRVCSLEGLAPEATADRAGPTPKSVHPPAGSWRERFLANGSEALALLPQRFVNDEPGSGRIGPGWLPYRYVIRRASAI